MQLNVNELISGMVLEQPILRKDGMLVLKAGTVLNERIIQHLRSLKNIEIVNVDSSQAEKTLEAEIEQETVGLQTRSETEEALKTFLDAPNDSNMQNIKKSTKKIVKNIEDENNFKYDLESYLNQKDIHAHSVRVACFSILLAKMHNAKLRKCYPNISESDLIDLEDIAVAALLHDIGKSCKDSEILKQITEVPNAEILEKSLPGVNNIPLDKYDERYSSVYSYCIVGDMQEVSSKAKLMILLSNEPDSEKGCLKVPFKVNTQKKPFMAGAKIIHVCDIYDNAMKRTIEQDNSLEEIASELGYYAQNGIVSSEVEQLLINNLPLYPVGTRLKLSSGEFAIVKESFVGPYDTYKPIVSTLNFPKKTIDLRDATNVTITSISSKQNLFKDLIRNQINAVKKNAQSAEYELD